LACLLTFSSFAFCAQERPVIQSKGEEVLLDVVVRDKKGAPVLNLTQADLSVLDEGQARPIKAFRLIRGTETVDPGGQASQLDPLRQNRLVSLVFSRMDPSARILARKAALELLKTNLPRNLYIGVFVLDQSLNAVQPFTTDRELLEKAIDKATNTAYAEFGNASDAIRDSIQNQLDVNQYGSQSLEQQVDTSNANDINPFSKLEKEMLLNMLKFSERAEVTQSGRSTIYALLAAVQAQSQLPGRKALIYFSSGFFIPQGAQETFRAVISAANRSNLSFYPIDTRGLFAGDTTAVGLNGQATSHLSAAASDMTAADPAVTGGGYATERDVYAHMRAAVSFDEVIDSGKYNTQDTLAILAQETGGFLTANTNDFRGPVQRIANELETYYEVSYDPQIAIYDGSFHHVVVNTARGDFHAITRAGYFALPHSTMLSPFEIPLLRALSTNPPAHAFAFESGALHFHGEDRLSTCGFLIDMPMSNITVRENKAKGTLNGGAAYVVLVKDSKGEVVKKLQGDIPIEITPEQSLAFKQSRFTDLEYFDIAPGRFTVEVAILDKESGQTSTRRSTLVVPSIQPGLSMSSVSLIRKWRPKEPDAATDDPFVVGDKTVTPTLVPKVNKSVSSSLPFYMVVYPDAGNPAPVNLTMEFSRDSKAKRLAAATLPAADGQGRIQHVANAPIEQFEPGNYAVRFVVHQGEHVTEENFAIVLEP
jgi:VWFA-related protein